MKMKKQILTIACLLVLSSFAFGNDKEDGNSSFINWLLKESSKQEVKEEKTDHFRDENGNGINDLFEKSTPSSSNRLNTTDGALFKESPKVSESISKPASRTVSEKPSAKAKEASAPVSAPSHKALSVKESDEEEIKPATKSQQTKKNTTTKQKSKK
jgi:FtsZ-interacting cell division protein ZipA